MTPLEPEDLCGYFPRVGLTYESLMYKVLKILIFPETFNSLRPELGPRPL
jgi:hypothetical protein